MSDLQCPATIVLLSEKSAGASELRELRLALVVLAADSGAGGEAAARQLAGIHSCELEAAGGMDGRALAQRIEQLADSYRGESVALLAGERALCEVLGRELAPSEPVVLAVDSTGWRVR